MRSLFQKISKQINERTFMTALAKRLLVILFLLFFLVYCSTEKKTVINSVTGPVTVSAGDIWLSHEHILVDFTGADSIDQKKWHHDSVIEATSDYFEDLQKHNVK